MSDYKGAALIIDVFSKAKVLLGDKGYDADWFRAGLVDSRIAVCIPSKANPEVPIPHDTALYRQRYKIENMFGKWAVQRCRYMTLESVSGLSDNPIITLPAMAA
ncbi:hypothetical protein OVY48_15510 [Sphingobium sp. SA2]|nr:hypothetical protein [Sphingobium sp. SA2]MDT7534820.1 hypothetical protein [Sphingobium sp. SA2]